MRRRPGGRGGQTVRKGKAIRTNEAGMLLSSLDLQKSAAVGGGYEGGGTRR